MKSNSANQRSFDLTILIDRPVPVVYSAPRLVLHVIDDFQPDNGGTLLSERMSIAGPRWLLGWVVSQANSVQQQMLANLKSCLEATNAPS